MTPRSALLKTAASNKLGALIIATAAVGGVAMVSSGVYAALNATASNTTPQNIVTDTLKLTLAPSSVTGLTGGVTTAISAVGPGDVVNRFLDLANTGTMTGTALKLSIADAAGTALTSNGTAGLQVAIFECSVPFTATTGACSGTTTTAMASTPALTLLSTPTAVNVASLATGTTRLRLQITLPTGSETTVNGVLPAGTIQGLTSQITWTFNEAQRVAATTNG